ncbi:hypothetical protein HH214_18920 [Mucilaginibacter robiniae]|uniref:Uncharacterized protein n=1 Tax=Mucilaginibacter robiniae TaxID=2728022 RepID=A0A7L5E347_9SPHI|nr:hypothetical protein [Mucilaginibacter robiniae]QJD97800.1 hypothetical protein HH214_18920 [Mucilaginibacter robiniae]
MKHTALQAIRSAEKLLIEKKIKYALINPPHFEKGLQGQSTIGPTDVWVLSYIYVCFQDEISFIYLNDTDLSLNHILTKHGTIRNV